jgi:hypothetical protein
MGRASRSDQQVAARVVAARRVIAIKRQRHDEQRAVTGHCSLERADNVSV